MFANCLIDLINYTNNNIKDTNVILCKKRNQPTVIHSFVGDKLLSILETSALGAAFFKVEYFMNKKMQFALAKAKTCQSFIYLLQAILLFCSLDTSSTEISSIIELLIYQCPFQCSKI